MEFVYDVAESATSPAVIKVIGLGGGGCNAINNMVANMVLSSSVPIPMRNHWLKTMRLNAFNWVQT